MGYRERPQDVSRKQKLFMVAGPLVVTGTAAAGALCYADPVQISVSAEFAARRNYVDVM